MLIAMDMQKLEVSFKHDSLNVLDALCHIEKPKTVMRIGHYDTIVNRLSELELKLFYRNCYDCDGELPSVADMREQVKWFCEAMDDSDVVPSEVFAQANCIRDNNKYEYVYAKGAWMPAVKRTLFEDSRLNTTLHNTDVKPIAQSEITPYNAPTNSAELVETSSVKVKYHPTLNNPFKKEN